MFLSCLGQQQWEAGTRRNHRHHMFMSNYSGDCDLDLADAYMEQRLALLGAHCGEDVVENEADGCMGACASMSAEESLT